jgi:S-DNA-T family DNA segregation ATPase FtsK/SpoIIIE
MSRRSRRRYANVYAPRSRFGRQPVPMLMYRDDDGFIIEGIRALSRLIWRYRSEIAPLAVGFVLWNVGGWLHTVHPGWAIPVGLLAAAGCGLIGTYGRWAARAAARVPGWPKHPPGWLQRRSERVYVAALVALVGGWLAGAAQWGPRTGILSPLAWLLLLGGALPWWTHHRRRARVRVERTLEAWPELGQRVGLPLSAIQSAVIDGYGWTARIVLSGGQTAADAINRIPAIESVLKVRPGSVRIEPDTKRADQLVMRVIETDPHATPLPLPEGLASTAGMVRRRYITRPLELGLFEDAAPVSLRVAFRHILIGGVVGSGKSGVLNVILAQLSGCVDAVMVGIDLKGGMELRPWMSSMAWLATTADQASRLLAALVGEVDRRAAIAADEGIRLWQPTIDSPAVVIVIDEYAELSEEAKAFVDSIARRGRAVAVTLLVATQRPTQSAMGQGAVRSQMDIRISLRVRERRDADLILGQGMLAAGWMPHTLDAPGKFLISSPEHAVPRRARAYLVDDDSVKDIAFSNRSIVRKLPLTWPGAAVAEIGHSIATKKPEERILEFPAISTPASESDSHSSENVSGERKPARTDSETRSEQASQGMWDALLEAGPQGATIANLITASGGMSRPWVYKQLGILAEAGKADQASRGRWRAIGPEWKKRPPDGPEGPDQPGGPPAPGGPDGGPTGRP